MKLVFSVKKINSTEIILIGNNFNKRYNNKINIKNKIKINQKMII